MKIQWFFYQVIIILCISFSLYANEEPPLTEIWSKAIYRDASVYSPQFHASMGDNNFLEGGTVYFNEDIVEKIWCEKTKEVENEWGSSTKSVWKYMYEMKNPVDVARIADSETQRCYIIGHYKSPGNNVKNMYALCVDKETGEELWRYMDTSPSITTFSGLLHMKKDNLVLAATAWSDGETPAHGYLVRLDGNGKKIWRSTVADTGNAKISVCLLSYDMTLLIWGYKQDKGKPVNGFLYNVNPENGKTVLKKHYGNFIPLCGIKGATDNYLLCGKKVNKNRYSNISVISDNSGDILSENDLQGKQDDVYISLGKGKYNYFLAGYTIRSKENLLWLSGLDINGALIWHKDDIHTASDAVSITPETDGGCTVRGLSWRRMTSVKYCWAMVFKKDGTSNFSSNKDYIASENKINNIIEAGHETYIATTTKENDENELTILKLNSTGDPVWEKSIGDTDSFAFSSLIRTKDTHYITLCGIQEARSSIIRLIKFDGNGSIIWKKEFSKEFLLYPLSLKELPDGNLMIINQSRNADKEDADAYIMLLDAKGTVIWEKSFGYDMFDYLLGIHVIHNDFIILCGGTDSKGMGKNDVWILAINESGEIIWEKTYGWIRSERGVAITNAGKDTFFILAYTNTFNESAYDIWVIAIDKEGKKIWTKSYASETSDYPQAILTYDKDYLIIYNPTHILCIDQQGQKKWDKNLPGTELKYISDAIITSTGELVVAGSSLSHVPDLSTILIKKYRISER